MACRRVAMFEMSPFALQMAGIPLRKPAHTIAPIATRIRVAVA
jgi:hypothetical protein